MELKKRWQPVRYLSNRFHWFLADTEPDHEASFNWGCIEAPSLDGPFRLEIWNGTENEWEFVEAFPTFKKAKEVGRLLAGVALNKNI